ncbi:DUF3105 domain-containing protein [Antrihabitans sp. YC3-6]|uniref:DUF3105 domain-containing protein n=1 Tax=Antrihabitans stalagmiti TaxID=2799499 RepID=A0A934NT43_9NOCA|nr:DUF3105 domain-containing protein [Antrihabitans stalagmiti]
MPSLLVSTILVSRCRDARSGVDLRTCRRRRKTKGCPVSIGSNKSGRGRPERRRAGKNLDALTRRRRIPWDVVVFAIVAVLLVGVIAYNLVPKAIDQRETAKFTPSSDNPDPSGGIDGVVKADYPAGRHVAAPQRVAYDKSPPFGGPHDQNWATCTGIVYPLPIRSETAVHSLEHGAVWITYNRDLLSQADIDALETQVSGQPYTLMSPYPGMSSAVSLQSWGRQLQLEGIEDDRIDQFVTALRQNPTISPEPGASCATNGGFDPDNPPPFESTAPGVDAAPMVDPAPGDAGGN